MSKVFSKSVETVAAVVAQQNAAKEAAADVDSSEKPESKQFPTRAQPAGKTSTAGEDGLARRLGDVMSRRRASREMLG